MRLRRTIDVELARDASLVLAEAVVFGRSAMGETVLRGHLFDRWRVRVGGALVFAETLRLDGAIAQRLAQRAVAADGVAVASVLKIPGDDEGVAAVRAMEKDFAGEVGVSAWNGLAVARLVAPDGAALRRDLVAVLDGARRRAAAAAVDRTRGTSDASHSAREGQAVDRHGGDGGAAPARARRQAQPSGGGGADLRFHSRRRARRPHASPS